MRYDLSLRHDLSLERQIVSNFMFWLHDVSLRLNGTLGARFVTPSPAPLSFLPHPPPLPALSSSSLPSSVFLAPLPLPPPLCIGSCGRRNYGLLRRETRDVKSSPSAAWSRSECSHACFTLEFLPVSPKGGRVCLVSPPCLESRGCHLIPLCYLLSCSSAG